jgi:hypothetical protein
VGFSLSDDFLMNSKQIIISGCNSPFDMFEFIQLRLIAWMLVSAGVTVGAEPPSLFGAPHSGDTAVNRRDL